MATFDLTSFMAGGFETVPRLKHNKDTYIGFNDIDSAIERHPELKGTIAVKRYLEYKNKNMATGIISIIIALLTYYLVFTKTGREQLLLIMVGMAVIGGLIPLTLIIGIIVSTIIAHLGIVW